ncbi:hypothetical protein PC110_g9584 [Phytophthora cactorum]|uniref:DUF6818 domain-containing protein n=1 Tax=Phytophthora cactorum TaxID=29920 RepID=A0A329SBQ2_9STRA|nr:hypothetical protein PC113_g11546 [Phytophthora cactorum]RAW34090.1 hypothetical protein PC110_g9584 [Phytophthora cactorum]
MNLQQPLRQRPLLKIHLFLPSGRIEWRISENNFNPPDTVFTTVSHFGWCDCYSPFLVGTCRNFIMQLYCNVNCYPYEGRCGNGRNESSKVFLANRLLAPVEEHLPLGKAEWERLGAAYIVTRARGWVERDFDSLRLKFKVLYRTRKPTGKPDMPPHINQVKLLKRTIDDKTKVVEMDDKVDEDQAEDEDEDTNERSCLFSASTLTPTTVFFCNRDGAGGAMRGGSDVTSASSLDSDASRRDNTPGIGDAGEPGGNTSSRVLGRVGMQDPLCTVVQNGLEVFATMASPTLTHARSTARQLHSTDSTERRIVANPPVVPGAPTSTRDSSPHCPKAGSRDEQEALRHTVKRVLDDDKKDMSEASYAKVKSTRALKENERRAKVHRAEDDQRCRDEKAPREARFLDERAEAEERRLQDNLELAERARRDKEESRARTQDLVLFISATGINQKSRAGVPVESQDFAVNRLDTLKAHNALIADTVLKIDRTELLVA